MNPLSSPIKMNGLRLSDRLVYLRQSFTEHTCGPGAHLYRILADEKINIEYLNFTLSGENSYIACCVHADDSVRVNEILKRYPLNIDVGLYSNSGTLSLYPHKHSLHALGRIFEVFGSNNHRFFHMASSGSILSFVVDFIDQEKIAASLVREINLPKTHTPFRQTGDSDDIVQSLNNKPETSATYIEPMIRTYGIVEKHGLFVYHIVTNQAGLVSAGKSIRSLADSGIKFDFVSAGVGLDGRIFIEIIAEASEQQQAFLRQAGIIYNGTGADVLIKSMRKADLIYFQGPHFGDRHGIADRAFSALLQKNVAIISAGCVGASIYIAVNGQTGVKAKNILGFAFDDPFKIDGPVKSRI